MSLFLVLGCISCKPKCHDKSNPDCEDYDPCSQVPYVTADFEIGQIYSASINPLSDPYKVFIVDSIFPRSCSIMFKAKIEGAKYKWKLGTETIETKEFSRSFKEPASTITVTLMVEKAPDKCHPNDDGKDTITKTFRLVNHCDLVSVGSYKGLIDDSKDSIVWKLMYVENYPSFFPPRYYSFCGITHMIITGSINFFEHHTFKDTIYDNSSEEYLITNRKVFLGTKESGGQFTGIGNCIYEIKNDNSVQFSYKSNGAMHTFRGIKIK